MQIMSGVPVVAAKRSEPLRYVEDSQEDALWHSNIDQNDVQLANIIRWTDQVFGKNSLITAMTDPSQFHPILDKKTVAQHLDKERLFLREWLWGKEKVKREAEAKRLVAEARQRDAEAKLRDAVAKQREAEAKLREAEAKQREAERKLKDAEFQLKNTQSKLKLAEESKPINRQMEALGKELRGLREKGHSSFSVALKLLIYKIAWIPEKILVFLMYYLRNGLKQTIKHIFRK